MKILPRSKCAILSKERNGQCKPWECPLKSTGGKYCFVTWLLGTAEEGGKE